MLFAVICNWVLLFCIPAKIHTQFGLMSFNSIRSCQCPISA